MPKRFFLLLALPFAFSCKSPPEQRHSTEEQPMTSQKSDPKGRGDSEGKGAPSSDLTAPSQNLVSESDKNSAMNLYDFSLKDIHGSALPLKNYAGQVVLIVNVASECGFTNQYAGLQKLYEEQERVVSRSDIIEYLWGEDGLFLGGDNKLDVYISNIRMKLGKEIIRTIKGV